MGVLKETLEALKAVILLQDEIKRLSSNTTKLAERVEDVQQRIIRLEVREETILSRAEAAAQLASSRARDGEIGDIRERLTKIELYLAATGETPKMPILLQATSDQTEPKQE